MRILHVHKYFHREDGASRYMVELMQLQEAAGHTVAPFAMVDPRNIPSPWSSYFVSNLDTRRVAGGLRAWRQFVRALWSREAAVKMEAMLKAFSPDVVHIHNIYNHLSPSILSVCRRHGVPIVMTVHDYSLVSANYALWTGRGVLERERRGLLATASTRFAKGSYVASLVLTIVQRLHQMLGVYKRSIARFMVFSRYMEQELVQAHFSKQKIVELFPFSAPLLLDGLPAKAKTRRGVLFAGRLEPYKGISVLLAAAKKMPDTEFLFAGQGSQEAMIVDAASRLENVRYLGFLSDDAMWQQMAAAQVVAVPSLWAEPFGLVALEALVIGTPILVSDRGALPELVRDNSFGRIFKADDPGDFVRQLKKFLAAPEGAQDMGKRGREWARKMASPEKHLARVEAVYEEALQIEGR